MKLSGTLFVALVLALLAPLPACSGEHAAAHSSRAKHARSSGGDSGYADDIGYADDDADDEEEAEPAPAGRITYICSQGCGTQKKRKPGVVPTCCDEPMIAQP